MNSGMYEAARTLAGGRSEGISSSFGAGLGGMVHVVAGALGVSATVLASMELRTTEASGCGVNFQRGGAVITLAAALAYAVLGTIRAPLC